MPQGIARINDLTPPKRKALGSNPDGCAIEKALIYLDKSGLFLYLFLNLFWAFPCFSGASSPDLSHRRSKQAAFSVFRRSPCLQVFCIKEQSTIQGSCSVPLLLRSSLKIRLNYMPIRSKSSKDTVSVVSFFGFGYFTSTARLLWL